MGVYPDLYNHWFVCMKTHPAFEKPPDHPGENPHPMELAPYILWRFLQMPSGGLYAKWDPEAGKGVWFYSQERDYMFREPRRDAVIYEDKDRSRFRSLIFRFGSLAAHEGLCGYTEFMTPDKVSRKYVVHSSFYPEQGIGLWIAITARDEPDSAANRSQPVCSETNRTLAAAGFGR
jgi:hypothetical protein